MPFEIRRVEYFRITVKDEPGQGFAVLSALSSQGVNLLAFTAIPVVSGHETQLTLYPDSSTAMSHAAASSGMALDGPHAALLVQGDDELGAIADIHGVLADAGINVASTSGVADGRRSFGYLLHLRDSDLERAANLLRRVAAAPAG